VALIFLAVTLFLVGLSFQMTDFGLRVETVAYATYVFFTGVAVLVLVEVLHLAKREIGKHHGS
jgi:drug/metabolite transporter (DMT)-like permease